MRVLITGASGYLGRAVTAGLTRRGHAVTALVRSAAAARTVAALGATPLSGDLWQSETWRGAAGEHEVLVHLAQEVGERHARLDALFLDTVLPLARGRMSLRALLYTSGTMHLGNTGGRPLDELAPDGGHGAPAFVRWRSAAEQRVLAAATEDFRTAVLRPGFVFGGDGGWLARFFADAEQHGTLRVPGPGLNHWSIVHREDLAVLYALLTEGAARGVFHGVDGRPRVVKFLVEQVRQAAGLPEPSVAFLSMEEARSEFGPLAEGFALDQRIVSARRHETGWQPSRTDLEAIIHHEHDQWRQARN